MFLIRYIRLLPITIFAAVLLISVKINEFFDGVSGEDNPVQLSSAVAQENTETAAPEENEKAETEGSEKVGSKDKDPGGEDSKAENDGSGESEETEKGAGEKEEEKASDAEVNEDNPDNDPTLFTPSEIDLLQQLADRREELEQRIEEINLREGFLAAAEKRIDQKIAKLRQLQATIRDSIKTHDDQQEAKIVSLVKIYEAMKPKDAARIFEQLEIGTILLVAERMKERRLAPVLAQMNSKKAKDVTVELSKLRDLPLPGSGGEQSQLGVPLRLNQ